MRTPAPQPQAGPTDDGGWGSVRADSPNGYLFEGEMGQLGLLASRLRSVKGKRGRAGVWAIRLFAVALLALLVVPLVMRALL